MTSRDVGTYPHIGYAFQGVPQAWDRGAPVLGEDNDYVFRKVLQLDDEEYQRLRRRQGDRRRLPRRRHEPGLSPTRRSPDD